MDKKYAVEIITGKGGGGHYASANAICAIASRQQRSWQIQYTDMDDIVAELAAGGQVKNAYEMFGFSGHDLYNLMLQSGWTWLWPLKMRLNKFLVKLNYDAGIEYFVKYWQARKPDVVVSVMPLYNRVLSESLEKARPGTPYITLPVDLADYPPAFWIEPETDNYTVCATEKLIQQAETMGVKPERLVKSSGMIVHPRFYRDLNVDRATERQNLGLDPYCPTGVVMFGGNGSKVMLDIARQLASFGDSSAGSHGEQRLQLIFLCGRNQELAQVLNQQQSEQKRFVTTFTDDIPYYMHLADFFIGKPGPGSLSEALVMGLPVVTVCNHATLIHERYNTEWVRQKQVGIVLDSFKRIDRAVEQLLDPQTMARYRSQVAALDNRAVFEVSELIQDILTKTDSEQILERN